MTLRTLSFGNGVQSNAMLVLAARREIDFPVGLFANVGDDSESPATLAYLHDHALPYAQKHGIEIVEVRRVRKRQGVPFETLYEYMTKPGGKSVPIPVRLSGGHPASRSCTASWKADVMADWRKDHGATEEDPCVVAIGFSWDESERMENKTCKPWEQIEYPLIDRRLTRADCLEIVKDAGLPPPPRSACWFCPWTKAKRWNRMALTDPEQFAKAVELEALLSSRTQAWKKNPGPSFMTDLLVPLSRIGEEVQGDLFDDTDDEPGCNTGSCFT